MILYYSGASNYQESQKNPTLSLGNYISSDAVPNDTLGATFKEISSLVKSRNDKQIFMLILKNTTGATTSGITIYYDYPTNDEDEVIGKYKLELAFVNPTLDSQGNPQFERINSSSSSPLVGTFQEYNTIANQATIPGSLTANQTLGIWFKVTLVSENNVPLTDQQLYNNYIADPQIIQETEQEINFIINYN